MTRAVACCIVIVRSSRALPTKADSHLKSAIQRFLKPVRNVRCTNAHISQPMNPPTLMPLKLTIALKREIVAMLPRSR